MKILIMMKAVPEEDYRFEPGTGYMDRTALSCGINSDDANMLEMALQLREKRRAEQNGETEITLLCMGPENCRQAIREGLAAGADEAYWICDPALRGADVRLTARCLALAVKRIGAFDAIFSGARSEDGATGHTAAMTAEMLNVPRVSQVTKIVSLSGTGFGTASDAKAESGAGGRTGEDRRICVERSNEGSTETVSLPMPCLLSNCHGKKELRGSSYLEIQEAFEKPLSRITAAELAETAGELGVGEAFLSECRIFALAPMIQKRKRIIGAAGGGEREALSGILAELIYCRHARA